MARKSTPLLPSKERLNELFHFDEESGDLIRKISVRGRNSKAGSVAGTQDARGYRRVGIDGVTYPMYRIIFFLTRGFDPGQGRIGYLDGVPGEHPLDATLTPPDQASSDLSD